MSEPVQPETPTRAADAASPILLSRGEFLWLTFAVWVGDIFVLAFTPLLLIPRLGLPWGVIASYLVFFAVWQPIQLITQRTLGMRTAFVRMLLFVAAGATIAFYLRELVLGLSRG